MGSSVEIARIFQSWMGVALLPVVPGFLLSMRPENRMRGEDLSFPCYPQLIAGSMFAI